VQTALAAKARLLETVGPMLRRPHADTLKNSKHRNMKELRFAVADRRFDDHLARQKKGD